MLNHIKSCCHLSPDTKILLKYIVPMWTKDLSGIRSSDDTVANYKTYFFLSVNNERAKQWCTKCLGRTTFLLTKQYFFTAIYTKDSNKEGLKQ